MSPDDPRAHARPNDAIPPDDSPSPAEMAFIERVRTDRERARTLRRRVLITVAASIAAIGVWFVTSGPRGHSAENVSTASTAPRTLDSPTAGATWEQRIAGLEARLGALEGRAAVIEHRAHELASAVTAAPSRHIADVTAAAGPASSSGLQAGSPARSRGVPPKSAATRRPPKLQASPTPPRDVKAVSIASPPRVPAVAAARQPVRARATQELTLGERVRRGWGAVERQVRRTPDEVREGFARVGRLFAD